MADLEPVVETLREEDSSLVRIRRFRLACGVSSRLQSLVRAHEEVSVDRFHQKRLTRRDMEELGVKVPGILDEASMPTGHGALARAMFGAVVLVQVHPLSWNFLMTILAGDDNVPEIVHVFTAGPLARHSHNRDGALSEALAFIGS